jgi:phospholipid/cholesterol/gamma-HCH transport system substrate-binding protein
MLKRSTKIQLVIFAILTLVGVSYVSAEYVGLTKGLFAAKGCTISADFPDSGGIFTNAEVTYRGVTVGKVGQLKLLDNGVRVNLKLTNCTDPKIPVSAAAQVSNRSVIGEQYVNLIPPDSDGPYLSGGQIIPMSRNKLPVATQALLTNLDNLVRSVNTQQLQVAVSELGKAFNNQGPALSSLLDSMNKLLEAAQRNLPETLALIKLADKVLQTQLDQAPAMTSWAHSLNLLSQQFKASDPDLRGLLANGPADLGVVAKFVTDNQTDLGVTFANLAATGQLLVRHLDGIEQIFEIYPAIEGGAYSVLGTDGVGALGLEINFNDPPDCGSPSSGRDGYNGTRARVPSDTSPQAPNTAAHCVPPDPAINVRGVQNVPGGDPISTSGSQVAYPRVTTANTVRVGATNGSAARLGDRSWIAMLTAGLH